MANTFKNTISTNIGTTEVAAFTSPVGVTSTIIGLTVANTTLDPITVDIKLNDSSAVAEAFIVKSAPIPAGGSLVVVGGNQKLILEENDEILITSSTATSCDAIISMLQQS